MQRKSCGTARRKALDKCLRKSYTICVVKNIWAYKLSWECKRIAFVPHRVVGIQMGSMSVGRLTASRPKYGPISSAGRAFAVRIRGQGVQIPLGHQFTHRFVRCGVSLAVPTPEVGCEPMVNQCLFEIHRFTLFSLRFAEFYGQAHRFYAPSRGHFFKKFPHHRRLTQP